MSSLIKFENVSLNFGGVNALTEVSFEVSENSLFAIIGPNGAGKTCLLYTSPSPRDRTRSRMPSSA